MNDMAGKPDKALDETGIIKSWGLRFPNCADVLLPRLRRLLRRGHYEHFEAEALQGQLLPEDVVVELGGGIGFLSAFMAKKGGVRHVHTFEPNPTLIDYMKKVHALNGLDNVTVTHAIVGPKAGRATFYQRDNMLASSLAPNPVKLNARVIAQHEVEVLDVKTVMADIKPSVLVCDIEGAEVDLLNAADLSGLRLVVIEIHPQWIGSEGTRRIFELMHDAGLIYFAKQSAGKVLMFKKGW